MWCAALFATLFIALQVAIDSKYRARVWTSVTSGNTPIFASVICGVLNYGLPHSLITLAQRSVTSVAVTIAQPCVSLVALFAAHLLLPDEKFSAEKLIPQLVALLGTILTSIPTFSSAPAGKSAESFDYFLLCVAVISFGVGTVSIKYKLSKADSSLACVFQLWVSALYATVFYITQVGLDFAIVAIGNISSQTLLWGVLLGCVYTYTSAILFVYVIKELGAVKVGLANFGQIVIGVIAGVVFLHEWSGYSFGDVVLSLLGLTLLTISILSGFLVRDRVKVTKNGSEYREVKTII
jgi:drug/metabolite transporter (DMT)-like permease